MLRTTRASSSITLVFALASIASFSACGGGSRARGEQLFPQLRAAIDTPLDSQEKSAEHSRLVEDVLESGALSGMTRSEVEAAIGRGDDCSRHPQCGEQEFEDDDWYYSVGRMGETPAPGVGTPVLIVGFDRFGKVERTWNLRTH